MDHDKGQRNPGLGGGEADAGGASIYAESPYFSFVYRKTEKIVTALYMVTSFMSDNEPLKWRIRTCAGDLLSAIAGIRDKFAVERDAVIGRAGATVSELVSCLDIAQYAGLLSEMNARVLKSELASYLELLKNKNELSGVPGILSIDHSFFGVSTGTLPAAAVHIKDRDYLRKGGAPGVAAYKGHESSGLIARPKKKAKLSDANSAEKRDQRRKTLIEVIKKKGKVMIKDVSVVFRDVSEKTIQRELLALVHEGVLKKEGERRWSTYSLVSA